MLSALRQGSIVHIIDKTSGIKYLVGEVINRTEPISDYTTNLSITPQLFFDLIVKANAETYEFKHISSSLSLANNGNIIISETKEGLIPIIEQILYTSKKAIEDEAINAHKRAITDCEDILLKLNPTFAKERERDNRIDSLEDKFIGFENKLDKLLTLLKDK